MKVAEVSESDLADRFRDGFGWRVGPYVIRLRTSIGFVADHLARLYGSFPVVERPEFVDAEVVVERTKWRRQMATIRANGAIVYSKVPWEIVVPLVEWTLNLCVFHRPSLQLLIHAAVVERNGVAAVFPGDAGAGKSTLCAALVHRGWRLLSDEVAPIRLSDGWILPVPRPISLKEASIETFRRYAPDAVLGPVWRGTAKGDLAHVIPPAAAVTRMDEPARPGFVIFPAYSADEAPCLEPIGRPQALLRMASHAFNYEVLGAAGFQSLVELVDRCRCYQFAYRDLEVARRELDDLWLSLPAADQWECHGAIG